MEKVRDDEIDDGNGRYENTQDGRLLETLVQAIDQILSLLGRQELTANVAVSSKDELHHAGLKKQLHGP